MNEVFWTELAKLDFREIIFYFNKNSNSYSKIFKTNFDKIIDKLLAFPNIGKDFSDGKEHPFENYRIIYKPVDNGIIIIRIIHFRQDL